NPKDAEDARTDLEADLNAGRYQDAGEMPWGKFRELFEAEYVATTRENTRLNYAKTLDLFEEHCGVRTLDRITVRTNSVLAAAARKARPPAAAGSTCSSCTPPWPGRWNRG